MKKLNMIEANNDNFEVFFLKVVFVVNLVCALAQVAGLFLDSVANNPSCPLPSSQPSTVQFISILAWFCVAAIIYFKSKTRFKKLVWSITGIIFLSKGGLLFVRSSLMSLHEKRLWFGTECFVVALIAFSFLLWHKKKGGSK